MKKISGVFMVLFFLMLAPLAVNAVNGEEEWTGREVKWVEPGEKIKEFLSLGIGPCKAEIRYLAYDGSKAVLSVTVKISSLMGFSVEDLPIAGYTVDLRLNPGEVVIVGDPLKTSVPILIEFLEKDRWSIKIRVAPAIW